MSINEDSLVQPLEETAEQTTVYASGRRQDIEAKQVQVAALLKEAGCDWLLILDRDNFAWLTSGGSDRGVLDIATCPALFCNAEERWLVCSNVDSQRLFDEELDGLGFQLKEWPWHWGREQLLADLCYNRKVACDQAYGESKPVAEQLRLLRRSLSLYQQTCLRTLGQIVAHALEATCRSLVLNETERDVAGQLSHRLLRHNAQPLAISVAADGRSRRYRQGGFTRTPIRAYGVLTVTARKYGLCASASRSVCFGPPDAEFRQEFDAASRIYAAYIVSTWPDAVPKEVLNSGRRVFKMCGYEHEWRLSSPGHITGYHPVELPLNFKTEELLQAGWSVTWRASAGAACSCDTFLITTDGPKLLTAVEGWPQKRVRIQSTNLMLPELLQR